MRGFVAAAGAAVILVGCSSGTDGASPTTSSPATSAQNGMPTQSVVAASPEQIDEWTTRSTNLVDQVQASMREMGTAAQHTDIDAMHSACVKIGDAGHDFGETLPAPERDVTALMRSAVDGIADAEKQCLSFGLSTPGGQFDDFDQTITAAMNDLAASAKVWGA